MMTTCKTCHALFDDADQTTICPHDLIMPAPDLAQKKAGLKLLEAGAVRFNHQPDGPDHRVTSVGWNGMIGLHDMPGEFAPHLFKAVIG